MARDFAVALAFLAAGLAPVFFRAVVATLVLAAVGLAFALPAAVRVGAVLPVVGRAALAAFAEDRDLGAAARDFAGAAGRALGAARPFSVRAFCAGRALVAGRALPAAAAGLRVAAFAGRDGEARLAAAFGFAFGLIDGRAAPRFGALAGACRLPAEAGFPPVRAGAAAALGLAGGFAVVGVAVCGFAVPADAGLAAATAAGFATTFGAVRGGVTVGRAGLAG
ncbi:MAG: hypothetical protein E6I55_05285 [Chloroflexi bacterium]|nr:MAG: hypothetical protein E6I55_05285 [Chloroflexota bacterium]